MLKFMSDKIPDQAPFAALLLAGGRSRRMGQDKAQLLWRNRPLWILQFEKLQALNPTRLLVACRKEQGLQDSRNNPNEVTTHSLDCEWLFDPPYDELGPLGAIERALRTVQMPLLTLAVDMLGMPSAFMQTRLLPQTKAQQGYFFETRHGFEPMTGLYVPAMLPVIQEAVSQGRLGLQSVLTNCVRKGLAHSERLSTSDLPLFANANTPEEWDHEKGRSD